MAAARRPPQLLLRRSAVCPVTVPDTQSASQTIWLPYEFNVFLDRPSWCNWQLWTDCVYNVCVPNRSRLNAHVYLQHIFYCMS